MLLEGLDPGLAAKGFGPLPWNSGNGFALLKLHPGVLA